LTVSPVPVQGPPGRSPPGDSLIKNPPFSKTIHEILAEFRWCREGAAGLAWRPGPRPAPLGRPGHISGVPSRPKHPAQPLALDVGSPRAGLVAGKGYNSSHVTRSPHPTGSACSHDPCASKSCSGALASCAVRERQGAPSRCEAQGCTADGTADVPQLWRAAASASML